MKSYSRTNSRNQTPKLFQARNPSYEQNPQKQTLKESNNELERETLQEWK